MQQILNSTYIYLIILTVLVFLIVGFQIEAGIITLLSFFVPIFMIGMWVFTALDKLLNFPLFFFRHPARTYRNLSHEEKTQLLHYYLNSNHKNQLFYMPIKTATSDAAVYILFPLSIMLLGRYPASWLSIVTIIVTGVVWVYTFYRIKHKSFVWEKSKIYDLASPVVQVYGSVYHQFIEDEEKRDYNFKVSGYKFFYNAVNQKSLHTALSLLENERVFIEFSPASHYIHHIERAKI